MKKNQSVFGQTLFPMCRISTSVFSSAESRLLTSTDPCGSAGVTEETPGNCGKNENEDEGSEEKEGKLWDKKEAKEVLESAADKDRVDDDAGRIDDSEGGSKEDKDDDEDN